MKTKRWLALILIPHLIVDIPICVATEYYTTHSLGDVIKGGPIVLNHVDVHHDLVFDLIHLRLLGIIPALTSQLVRHEGHEVEKENNGNQMFGLVIDLVVCSDGIESVEVFLQLYSLAPIG